MDAFTDGAGGVVCRTILWVRFAFARSVFVCHCEFCVSMSGGWALEDHDLVLAVVVVVLVLVPVSVLRQHASHRVTAVW